MPNPHPIGGVLPNGNQIVGGDMGEEEGDQGGGGAARPEGELQEPALPVVRWDTGLGSVR